MVLYWAQSRNVGSFLGSNQYKSSNVLVIFVMVYIVNLTGSQITLETNLSWTVDGLMGGFLD